jgi:hypothetical protein
MTKAKKVTKVNTKKFKKVKVRLTGTDGNAFAVLGKVGRALKAAGATAKEVNAFYKEAMAGDYLTLLATAMKWVTVT